MSRGLAVARQGGCASDFVALSGFSRVLSGGPGVNAGNVNGQLSAVAGQKCPTEGRQRSDRTEQANKDVRPRARYPYRKEPPHKRYYYAACPNQKTTAY